MKYMRVFFFFSLTLQAGISAWQVFSKVKDVLEHRQANPDVDLTAEYDVDVKMAYDRFMKFHKGMEDLKAEMKAKSWKDESQFNLFVASKILQPLSGGLCVIRSNEHRSAVKDSREQNEECNENIKLPKDIGFEGLGMGK